MYRRYIKRWLDILCSLVALCIFSLVILIVALLVKIKLGSPVIYKQKRPGKDEKIFNMYKFRSMTNEKDQWGNLLSDEKRLTKFGKILRSTSLDELPEFYNILKGDMSLVGPRPLLIEYLPLYSEEQRRRHMVRPGLTGLAQIKGRNLIDWEEKFKWDIIYIEKISFFTDISILWHTIKKVLRREGISSNTTVTMEPFKGNKI